MNLNRRVFLESLTVALGAYVIATAAELAVIRFARPTEWELAWVSDTLLAVALGTAVYLWRSLLQTRRLLAERERSELVLHTQLSVAADIQRRLLPSAMPADAFLDCAAALRSAGQIGGDFYDFVALAPRVWLVLVADVSGKGIPAAMALGSLRSAFRTLATETSDLSRLMTQLSAALYEQWGGAPYVTCIMAALDLNACTLAYTNAGHPAGLIAGAGATRLLTIGGPPAGLFPGARFAQEVVRLEDGDVCLLVSDGVTEAFDGSKQLERALTDATARGNVSAAALRDTVMAQAIAGPGPSGVDQWEDDRTVVVVRMTFGGKRPATLDASVPPDVAGLLESGRTRSLR